ncbi:hypothetical protein [Fibrella aquatica]|uniref:hypothetical protein n=1 Tax=Fibrella aquatica TaxID=3242487 RepID=UPI0035206EAE
MKFVSYILLIVALVTVTACRDELFTDTSFIGNAAPPDKLAALFDITQDNTGMVTITPNGEGAASFVVDYGDGTANPPTVIAGGNARHKYAEGTYNVKITGISVTGKKTESTHPLTVSFKAPENVEMTATIDPANVFKVNVTAKGTYETLFKVYFGDVPNEVPQSFLEGETVSHTYTKVGDYAVKVVALSGGKATTEVSKTVSIVNPVLLPLDFETPGQTYTFANFDGGNTSVIDNPKSGGINTSAKVGRMIKGAGQPWGGSLITLGGSIDFSTNKTVSMKVFSPRVGAKVLLKVENKGDGSVNFEKEVVTTKANAWEELLFDYSAINTTKTYQNIVLIFDNGTPGNGSANFTFYFDDIKLVSAVKPINLPVTFDEAGVDYSVTDFGNNNTVDGVDPTNSANKVKITTKPTGAETWAGTTIGLANGFASPINLVASSPRMSVRVYAPAAGIQVRLKLEDHTNGSKSVETEATTTVAKGWEELIFDFSKPAAGTPALNSATTYDKASIFFDFGTAGTGKVFYWDDVKLAAPVVNTTLALPLGFESTTLKYNFTNFDGGTVTVVPNPQSGGINTSATVAKMVKNAGQPWGGSFIALDKPIDFTGKKTVSLKVFSPRVGAKVLVKVENATDGGVSFEKEVVTTKANAWEELSVDYSAIDKTKSYQKIVLIFDNGTPGNGSANFTFYFDDITLN